MPGEQGRLQSKHLLDLLEQLPLDDVDDSHISEPHSFRLICKQSRQMADQLTTSTHHNLHHPPPGYDDSDIDDSDDSSLATAVQEELLWREATAARAAFLARLPRLTALTLSCWTSELALTSEVFACGAASQGRVTRLELRGHQLSAGSLRAVRLAFPQLRELSLHDVEVGGTADLDLRGSVFLPLHGTPWLTKLSVCTDNTIPLGALRSLAGLATLKHLHLNFYDNNLEPRHLRLLTGLHGLEHCTIGMCLSALPDVALLLAATGLTRLDLLGSWLGEYSHLDTYPAAEHTAALSLLGGLSHLQSLHLDPNFVINADTFAAVRRLTQLTELSMGEVQPLLSPAAPAHFPLLQRLELHPAECVLPLLLQSLMPFLPLPSLASLNKQPSLAVDVGGDDGENGAAPWTVVLHAVLAGLASSPLLGGPGGLRLTNAPDSPSPRSLAQVAHRLRPTMPGLLRCVTLEALALEGAPWGLLHTSWPGLRMMVLLRCEISTGSLVALVQAMVTLQRLDVEDCEGREVEEGGGWAGVAQQCCRLLRVRVGPVAVPAEVRARCRVVQQLHYGVQNLHWLD